MDKVRIAQGSSMLPFVRPADFIATRPATIQEFKRGDLVLFTCQNDPCLTILHRVISKGRDNSFLLAKGDNILGYSQKVLPGQVREKCIYLKRGEKLHRLDTWPRQIAAFLFAFFSWYNCTPYLFKRRFIDPFILFLLRKNIYLSASLVNRGITCFLFNLVYPPSFIGAWRVIAFAAKQRCGSVDVVMRNANEKRVGLLINLYLRQRVRTESVMAMLVKSACECAMDKKVDEIYVFLEEEYKSFSSLFLQYEFKEAFLTDILVEGMALSPMPLVFKKVRQ